jgi:hypothetical protein
VTFNAGDSRARWAITRVVPRLHYIDDIHVDVFDREYRDFVRRCLWLRNKIIATYNKVLTPRQLDRLLLTITG